MTVTGTFAQRVQVNLMETYTFYIVLVPISPTIHLYFSPSSAILCGMARGELLLDSPILRAIPQMLDQPSSWHAGMKYLIRNPLLQLLPTGSASKLREGQCCLAARIHSAPHQKHISHSKTCRPWLQRTKPKKTRWVPL